MKNILFGLSLLISLPSIANEIHLKNGETLKVIVDGCKISEYGNISTGNQWAISDKVVAGCYPRICTYRIPTWFGTAIKLYPGGGIIARTSSKSETRAVLRRLVRDGVCAKTEGYGPEM